MGRSGQRKSPLVLFPRTGVKKEGRDGVLTVVTKGHITECHAAQKREPLNLIVFDRKIPVIKGPDDRNSMDSLLFRLSLPTSLHMTVGPGK